MKKPLLLFLFSIVSLAVQAVDIQDVVERPSGSKIVHIDVYIDQPNVEDCYETSVPDLYDSGIFKVYPNPNQGIFNLEIDYLYKGENIRIAIYDLTGKKMYFSNVLANDTQFTLELNLSTIPKGVYFIQVKVHQHSKVERLIIF